MTAVAFTPLDGIASNVDFLEMMVVRRVGGPLFGLWKRRSSELDAEAVSLAMTHVLRAAEMTRPAVPAAEPPPAGTSDGRRPLTTVELPDRIALVIRVEDHAAAFVFDVDAPLGLARLAARRAAALVAAELPAPSSTMDDPVPSPPRATAPAIVDEPTSPSPSLTAPQAAPPNETEDHDGSGDTPRAGPVVGEDTQNEGDRLTLVSGEVPSDPGAFATEPTDPDRDVATLAYRPPDEEAPAPRAYGRAKAETLTEIDRARRLLDFIEERAPEPHLVKLRVALRTGLTLAALEHPEGLSMDATVLIETAAEEILGVTRDKLRGTV